MVSDNPEPDENTNICPICMKDFGSIAGIRQLWTNVDTDEEIQVAITKKASQQSPTSSITGNNGTLPTSTSFLGRNKIQIINDDSSRTSGKSYQQLNIIENDAIGDCLILALVDILRNPKNNFNHVPNHAYELRIRAVNYILTRNNDSSQLNFVRFKDSIITNLQNYIPSLSRCSENNSLDENITTAYSDYMSTPGNCGTTAELCAITELFGFAFCVIQENNPVNYTCYDYGSNENVENDTGKPTVHLLFTGSVDHGHFQLLDPIDDSHRSHISTGNYKLVTDYTSSRMKSIAHASHNASTQPTESQQATKSELWIQNPLSNYCLAANETSRFYRARGARISAANKLAQCIEECFCLSNSKSDNKWEKLLTFAYTALQVPGKTRNVSLTSLVKRNLDEAVLNIPKSSKRQVSISISRRVEYKISEGDVKGAVKISSMDTLAPQNKDTLDRLKFKHPPPSKELHFPNAPDLNVEPLIVSEKEVFKKSGSFPNGSGSGVDGILPQHLKDMTSPSPHTSEAGLRLLRAITKLSNFMLAGKMPSNLCAFMYGASGGLRPIAIGNTFRRLTSKLACASVRSEMASKFAPRQVGFGIRGGYEAAVHATRTFIKKNCNARKVVTKIDFRNAFNEIAP